MQTLNTNNRETQFSRGEENENREAPYILFITMASDPMTYLRNFAKLRNQCCIDAFLQGDPEGARSPPGDREGAACPPLRPGAAAVASSGAAAFRAARAAAFRGGPPTAAGGGGRP